MAQYEYDIYLASAGLYSCEMMGHLGQYENIKNRQTSHLARHDSYQILDIEIDHSLESTCSSGLCDVTDKDIPLFGYSDVPEFLKGNPYVTSGYRVSLPFSLCLKRYSIFLNLNWWGGGTRRSVHQGVEFGAAILLSFYRGKV